MDTSYCGEQVKALCAIDSPSGFTERAADYLIEELTRLGYAPQKGIVSPYFSIEIYQSLDDAPFWRTARLRYRPGIEIDLTKRWSLDAFYCYQYESSRGKHIAGVEVGYSF